MYKRQASKEWLFNRVYLPAPDRWSFLCRCGICPCSGPCTATGGGQLRGKERNRGTFSRGVCGTCCASVACPVDGKRRRCTAELHCAVVCSSMLLDYGIHSTTHSKPPPVGVGGGVI